MPACGCDDSDPWPPPDLPGRRVGTAQDFELSSSIFSIWAAGT